MESNQISKVAEIDLAKIFSIFLQAAKYAGEKAGHSPFDEYGEAKLAKYITIMINFILFIAGKQDDPVSRDLFSRLGLILFMLLMGIKQLNGIQRGGVRVIRNNLVMDVEPNELQPGDHILGDINAGAQFGNQVANYGNRLYDQAVIQQQPPQGMEITANERGFNQLQRQNQELELRILNQNLNLQLEVQEGRRSLIKGEVSSAEVRNQAMVSMTAGSCCAIFMNVCTKVTINAGDNCSDVTSQIFVNANELCKKGVAAIPSTGDIIPDAIPAFGNLLFQVGAMANRNVKAAIEAITPQDVNPSNITSMGNSGNVSITDLMNEPDVDLTFKKQTDCFEMIWSNMSQRMEESKEIMGRTDVQCGICCCVGVFTVLNYSAYCRAQRARQIIIEGGVGERINYENNQNALRVAQIAAGIGAVGAVATGVPPPIVAAGMAAVNNALAPQNNGTQSLGPNLVDADPTATTGIRQRITNNNTNGGYKKTKKTKRNNKKSKKTKRNNKKTKRNRKTKRN